jgi:hypothetical protein
MNFTAVLLKSLQEMHYVVFLVMIMIIAGIIKEHNLFADGYLLITKRVRNKKIVLALVSLFGGVLPISGRVSVSAGILSTIAPDSKTIEGKRSKAKFGIIDYLATHHYYLWSPLEKTVILPMAALSIGWVGFMSYTLPLLLISIAFIAYYISMKIDNDDIELKMNGNHFLPKRFALGFLPFAAALALIIGFELGLGDKWKGNWALLSVLALYYAFLTKTWDPRKISSFIQWKLIAFLALVIVLGTATGAFHEQIKAFIKASSILDIQTIGGLLTISAASFLASWFLGSSGKFAGILVILMSIYGPDYLVWFFALEFAGYNFSPMHKCVPIGKMYFDTKLSTYASALSTWMFLLVSYAAIKTFVLPLVLYA